jgi:hypothetical protein
VRVDFSDNPNIEGADDYRSKKDGRWTGATLSGKAKLAKNVWE